MIAALAVSRGGRRIENRLCGLAEWHVWLGAYYLLVTISAFAGNPARVAGRAGRAEVP